MTHKQKSARAIKIREALCEARNCIEAWEQSPLGGPYETFYAGESMKAVNALQKILLDTAFKCQ